MSEAFYIDKLANSGIEVKMAGATFRVRQLTLRDQGVLQAIIRKLQPFPSEKAKKLVIGMDKQVAGDVMKEALKADLFYPTPVASPEGLQLLVNSDEGQKALLKAAIGRNEGVSDSTIEDLYGELSYAEFMRIAAIAVSGEDPENDPKAE
jgi:hypothetical protein